MILEGLIQEKGVLMPHKKEIVDTLLEKVAFIDIVKFLKK